MSAPAAAPGLRFEHDGSLAQRAAVLLRSGPLPTAEVAARVMGVRGQAGPAARAVFALLGGDERFAVSADGVWSLVAAPAPPACDLDAERFVVVDVETTGGSPASGHRITEIAAVEVAGGAVVDRWSALVNPGRRIPFMIQSLTGITDAMVRDAPPFAAVASEVSARLEGRVFVAHNAAFDWRFVTDEMERATGTVPAGRTLCTVRVARKLLPQLTSRSLGALADFFGLEIESRHRALDDAVATAHVLLRFVEMLRDADVRRWDELERYLSRRTPRAKRRATPRSMTQA